MGWDTLRTAVIQEDWLLSGHDRSGSRFMGGLAESAVVLRSPVREASAVGATWVMLSSQPSNPAHDAGDSCPDGGDRLNSSFQSFLHEQVWCVKVRVYSGQ
jgi:hypothetical protein